MGVIGQFGRHAHPVVRPGFKPGGGRQPFPGRFDSCYLPPLPVALRPFAQASAQSYNRPDTLTRGGIMAQVTRREFMKVTGTAVAGSTLVTLGFTPQVAL